MIAPVERTEVVAPTESEGKIPLSVLGDVEKALNNARTFANRFTTRGTNGNVFSDTLKDEARRVVSQVSKAFTGLDVFLEELEDDDEDDD
jgi:hypothetical protein